MMSDPRTTPARPDLAAAHLAGRVEAARFAEPAEAVVCVPVAPMTAGPDGAAPLATQLLFGERVAVYETEGQWAWGQAALDGYVGYLPRACLDDPAAFGAGAATHRVAALSTHVYPEPEVKSRPGAVLGYGARLGVLRIEGAFAALEPGGFVPARHLAPLDAPFDVPGSDWAEEAARFLGVPYLWGGRSPLGIDCSGLVQLALQAAGHASPRDSDQQEAALGRTLAPGERPRRGDLVFWRGHVGLMLDGTRLLHANIHHMCVAAEPLAAARARIRAAGGGRVTRIARLDAGAPPA